MTGGTDELWPMAAAALGLPAGARAAGGESFTAQGGSSLDALNLVASAQRRHGLELDLAGLLGPAPLTDVLTTARRCAPAPEPLPDGDIDRPALLFQREALLLERFAGGGPALRQLVSVELTGPLDEPALLGALDQVVARHDALRTVFVRAADGVARRVLPSAAPRLIRQRLRPVPGTDPVRMVHDQLGAASAALLAPMSRPPVVFALSRFGEGHHLLSLLLHHVLADGWAAGLLLREIAERYTAACAGAPLPVDDAPRTDGAVARFTALRESGRLAALLDERVAVIGDAVSDIDLPSGLPRPDRVDFAGAQLPFTLSGPATRRCARIAADAKVTRTTVLFAAWALVIGRRCGLDRFCVAISTVNRPTPEALGLVASLASSVPVPCTLDDAATVREHMRNTAAAIAETVRYADVSVGSLIERLGGAGERRRHPLSQVMFSAHDDVLPERLDFGGLGGAVHEGFCGGSATEAGLYVRHWGERPRLALEYATSVLGPADAAELTEAFDATLVELAEHLGDPVAEVRTMSPRQRADLAALGRGVPADVDVGLWGRVAETARRAPDAVAVTDPGNRVTLTYAELVAAAERQSERLYAAGVRPGSHVLVALPRSAAEIVAVLAIVRIGAAYAGLDRDSPPARQAVLADRLAPDAVITDGPGANLARTVVAPISLSGPPCAAPPRAAPPDPERPAYTVLTSGSTGAPKAVRVPCRALLRLVSGAEPLRLRPDDRFLRFAALCFDIGSLEIFGPLVAGATVVVHDEDTLSARGLAEFLLGNRVSVACLPAGLVGLMAEHAPEGLGALRHLLVGGDVAPAAGLRALLERYPGLLITNGYGPTENGVLTTAHHVADPTEVGDALPVGGPVPGTVLEVLDPHGHPVPPGAPGELYVAGDGLALDYHGEPDRTREAFPVRAGARVYRTGDLVRWDAGGRLCFLGRTDRQVKIRGFRVELDEIGAVLLRHPAVRDAAVVAAGTDTADRRVLAGVVLAGDGPDTRAAVREFAAERLPAYAVPALWAFIDELPLTAAGKYDVARLAELAAAGTT